MSKKFKHLNLSPHWQQYFSKYPDGYTIIENLIDWVSQVDSMVDSQNTLTDRTNTFGERLDSFLGRFDGNLRNEVETTLREWQSRGFLDVVIGSILETKYHEMDDRLTSEMERKPWRNEVLLKEDGVGLDNIKSDLLTAIQNNDTETTFKLLSIPRPGSVTPDTTNFFIKGLNLFNKNDVAENHLVAPATGELTSNEGYVASNYILVEPSTTYTKTGGHSYAIYDENKEYIEGDQQATFTTPVNGRFVRLTVYRTYWENFQLQKGAVLDGRHEFFNKIDNRFIDHPYKEIEDFPFMRKSTNLFDEEQSTKNTTLYIGDGTTRVASDFVTSGFIPVEGGSNYTVKDVRIYSFYTENQVFISSSSDSSAKMNHTLTTPTSARYIRFSWYTLNTPSDEQQMNKGSSLLDYQPFGEYIPKNLLETWNTVEKTKEGDVSINIPEIVYATRGEELTIFNDNMLGGNYDLNYQYSDGRQMSGRYTFTPPNSNNFALFIEAFENAKRVGSKMITVYVNNQRATPKKVIVIGDSTVTQRHMLDRTKEKLGGNVELVGTRGTEPTKHEGRAGWTTAMYRTNAEYDGIVNPFYNHSTEDFDFAHYMNTNSLTGVDVVAIQLGINDMFSFTTDGALDRGVVTTLENLMFIINNIKAYSQDIRVAVNIPIPPNHSQDAFGLSYGTGQTQWRYKRNNHIFVSRLIERLEGVARVDLVPTHLAIDTDKGMSDGVHPNKDGYYQMASMFTGYLNSL